MLGLLVLPLPHSSAAAEVPEQAPLGAAAEAALEAGRPGLSGTVVDSSGAVIAGALIQLVRVDGAVQLDMRSDGSGSFAFRQLAPGRYRLLVLVSGFRPKTVEVELAPDAAPKVVRLALDLDALNTAITVQGRADDLIGIADSSTQGSVGSQELQDRPTLRSGELLETIPGVIVTQHAGGGKANQYFLRGFNLDHGTDFAIFVDGMPLNLPSHAHGEGYADMNTVIPELVERIDYEKGPYYADVGNYGSAGSAHLQFFRNLPQNFIQAEGGTFGYGRVVFGASHKLVRGSLIYGGEVYHDDGPWTHPDNFYKLNGLLTYSQGVAALGFSITARGYHSTWHSSDQIAASAVPLVGYFGTLNPTDGGQSQRYSLQGEWHHQGAKSRTSLAAYGFFYDLNLFSDFTYYLTDPLHGDQFNQQDRRWVAGMDAHRAISGNWASRRVENTVGLQIRNDWIHNGLYQTQDRVRRNKIDAASGNALPATTQADHFIDLQVGVYAENRVQWATKMRSVVSLRGDVQHFGVTSLVNSANSGTATKILPSPKAGLAFGPWLNTEMYVQAGFSFHSNDGRGATLHEEPISSENPSPSTPASPIPALIPTKGGEFGLRTSAVPHLRSTFSLWYLHSASELQQSGDTGNTVASRQPSERYGIEWANFFSAAQHWTVDLDLANSKALFTQVDAEDAAPASPGGKRVPEAVGLVLASGVTLHDLHGFSSSLRLRYFGSRDLTSDGAYRSQPTALLNGELRYSLGERWGTSAELLNLLNRRDHDIDYAYLSRITPASTPAFTNVFHPVEPFQARFWLRRTF